MIKENQSLLNKVNILTDLALLFAAMLLSYVIRVFVFTPEEGYIRLGVYFQLMLLAAPAELILYGLFGLYDSFRAKSFRRECTRILQADLLLLLLLLSLSFIFKTQFIHISRWTIVFFAVINFALVAGKRWMLRRTLASVRAKGYNLKSLIVLGSGPIAREYLDVVRGNQSFGYHYAGYVAEHDGLAGKRLGGYADLERILTEKKPDEVVCALDLGDAGYLEGIVSDCEKTGTKISIIPFCYKYIPSQPYIDQIAGIPLINIRRIPLDNLGNKFLKRAMDLAGSFLLLILFSPVMLVTAIGVKLSSPGPVIFKQERVGLNKQRFLMYKFRSMRVNDQSDTAWSTKSDDRRTRFGSFIRKCSLDELPQLWNVFTGSMSLVGPRPELPYFVENFKESIPLYMVKHQVKPGITGLAQVRGFRGDTSIKKRIECDIEYIENWTFFGDISILFQTVFKGFRNEETLSR